LFRKKTPDRSTLLGRCFKNKGQWIFKWWGSVVVFPPIEISDCAPGPQRQNVCEPLLQTIFIIAFMSIELNLLYACKLVTMMHLKISAMNTGCSIKDTPTLPNFGTKQENNMQHCFWLFTSDRDRKYFDKTYSRIPEVFGTYCGVEEDNPSLLCSSHSLSHRSHFETELLSTTIRFHLSLLWSFVVRLLEILITITVNQKSTTEPLEQTGFANCCGKRRYHAVRGLLSMRLSVTNDIKQLFHIDNTQGRILRVCGAHPVKLNMTWHFPGRAIKVK